MANRVRLSWRIHPKLGGDILNPILTLTAPEDLTGAPSSIEHGAVAEAEVDGVLQVVHQDHTTTRPQEDGCFPTPSSFNLVRRS